MTAGRPAPSGLAASAEDQRSDSDLLQAHVAGDPAAFGILVARHADRMWAVALRTMRDPEEAADALQDAYLAAFRRAASFRGEARVTTWLHRVVVNACVDRIRRNRSRAADPLPTESRSPDRTRVASTGDPGPADALELAERHTEVVRALAELNPDQRIALILVDMEGYPVEEAAQILGCATGTVKSRCARGRARLLPLLGHLREQSEEPS